MSSAVPHVPSTPGVAPCWKPYCTTVVKLRLVVAAIVAVMGKSSNHRSSMPHQDCAAATEAVADPKILEAVARSIVSEMLFIEMKPSSAAKVDVPQVLSTQVAEFLSRYWKYHCIEIDVPAGSVEGQAGYPVMD